MLVAHDVCRQLHVFESTTAHEERRRKQCACLRCSEGFCETRPHAPPKLPVHRQKKMKDIADVAEVVDRDDAFGSEATWLDGVDIDPDSAGVLGQSSVRNTPLLQQALNCGPELSDAIL